MIKNKIQCYANLCVVACLMLMMQLTGCATSSYAPESQHMTGYAKTGIASTYGNGDGFNGRRMANGQRFNKNNPHIAASPTLPLGSKVKVTNLENNRSTYVEITDRMGHVKHRIIDLSYAAAKTLHIRGLARVHIEVVSNSTFKQHISHEKSTASNSSKKYKHASHHKQARHHKHKKRHKHHHSQ